MLSNFTIEQNLHYNTIQNCKGSTKCVWYDY